MKIIRSIKEMQEYSYYGTVGFVPTMGAIHEGHLSLIESSKAENDITVVSIYVNPKQFISGEDYDVYPRNQKADIEKLSSAGVDIVFIPDDASMYLKNSILSFCITDLTDFGCGINRPGHFQGVALVLTKLFNIVRPNRTYFGQKDYQQAYLVKRLIEEFNFPIEFRLIDTVREHDGLARSSRNVYLNGKQRNEASAISLMLDSVNALIKSGERDLDSLVASMYSFFDNYETLEVDYVDLRRADDLMLVSELVRGRYVLLVAVYAGETRLIDNCIVDVS